MRGAAPRRVESGWGGETGAHSTVKLVGGLNYEKVTVNKLWPTITRGGSLDYVGPREILEGRAFVLQPAAPMAQFRSRRIQNR